MKNLKLILLITSASLLLQSCATILAGTKGKIEVNQGQPANAQIFFNGNLEGNAPKTISVSKNSIKNNNAIVEIKSDGYETSKIILSRKVMAGHCMLDFFFTGLTGFAVDFATGAIYKPLPKNINYNLNKSKIESDNKTILDIGKKAEPTTQTQSLTFNIGDYISFKNDKGEYYDGKIVGLNQTTALVQYKTTSGEVLQYEVEISKLFKL